jgi:L-aspartate oxidase
MNGPYQTIVIGSGAAGLFTAIEAARLGPVLVLTKAAVEDCNTYFAQGGIAAAVGPLDTPEQHLKDTIAAGAGLVDEGAARVLCLDGPARIADLVATGVIFDREGGTILLAQEAAHATARVLHAGGDRTGAEIERALAASAGSKVELRAHTRATRLLTSRGRVCGVAAVDVRTGESHVFEGEAVVIASGGAGQLYSHTTNPEVATGDGIALAFAAGAEVADLEFFQFHPTAFRRAGFQPFLISEAVRGEGAILRNAAGEAFMKRYHERAELAPRDVVARAIVAEMHAEGSDHVVLDCTGLCELNFAARFPGIHKFCTGAGIDPCHEGIPVAPAAHYFMGGIRTDTWGRTTVPGLYACGEAACTGVHGANRLASNSLLETVVFGKRVVEHIASGEGGMAAATADPIAVAPVARPIELARLQALMWRGAGIERDAHGLRQAIDALARPEAADGTGDPAPGEMTIVASLILEAALRRTESRGAHFRTDFPLIDDVHWKRRQVFRRAD